MNVLIDHPADGVGGLEDRPQGNQAAEAMFADGVEAGGGHATALLAIRIASELARGDPGLEIRRVVRGRPGKDAGVGRWRRFSISLQDRIGQLQFRV